MKRACLPFLIAVVIAISLYGLLPADSAWAATCTSTKSGNWNDPTVWDCGLVPGAGDDVTIRSIDQITLTQDESVNNITIQSAANRLLGAFTLQVFGTLNSDTTNPNANIISASTLIRFVGSTSRALFGPNWGGNTSGLSFEVALDSSATGTITTSVKGKSITIVSGTFDTVDNTNDIRPDAGSPNTGILTINAGATLIVRSPLSRIDTSPPAPFAAFTNNGTFKTSSISANVWPGATPCTFAPTSTVEYNYNSFGAQTIQTPLGSSYGNLVLSGNGSKTAPANLQIRGNLTVNNVTFTAGAGTVEFIGTDEQAIGGNRAVAFNVLNIAAGAKVVIPTSSTAVTLTNYGTITQTRVVTGTTDVNFLGLGGYGGVTLNANASDLLTTTVAIRGNQVCNRGDELIHRCFDIIPANDTGRDATITFAFANSELNSNDCDTMNAYHWNGTSWDSALAVLSRVCPGAPFLPYLSLQVNHVATFSPFGLKSGAVAPTAVTVIALKAHSTTQSTTPIFVALLAVLAICGVTLFRRR